MNLSEIWIYPIKSLGGIRLSHAFVSDRGLAFDRRWMLVDEQGVFLTQRQNPVLALFQPTLEENVLKITHQPSGKSISFATDLYLPQPITTQIWDDTVEAYEVTAEVSAWFSALLSQQVRLVYMPDHTLRKVDAAYMLKENDITSFSDGYPILIIGQASLDDLNQKLAQPVPINRFRPNLVFTGGEAFEEETWHEFTIGDSQLFGVKPCARCILTTIDHQTGKKTGKDPLYTLSTYRKAGNRILFGQNVLIGKGGSIAEGDTITIHSTKILPKFQVE